MKRLSATWILRKGTSQLCQQNLVLKLSTPVSTLKRNQKASNNRVFSRPGNTSIPSSICTIAKILSPDPKWRRIDVNSHGRTAGTFKTTWSISVNHLNSTYLQPASPNFDRWKGEKQQKGLTFRPAIPLKTSFYCPTRLWHNIRSRRSSNQSTWQTSSGNTANSTLTWSWNVSWKRLWGGVCSMLFSINFESCLCRRDWRWSVCISSTKIANLQVIQSKSTQ